MNLPDLGSTYLFNLNFNFSTPISIINSVYDATNKHPDLVMKQNNSVLFNQHGTTT